METRQAGQNNTNTNSHDGFTFTSPAFILKIFIHGGESPQLKGQLEVTCADLFNQCLYLYCEGGVVLRTNLSLGKEAVVTRVTERLRIHHLRAMWVHKVGAQRRWATIALYPWGTGWHYWWVLLFGADVM